MYSSYDKAQKSKMEPEKKIKPMFSKNNDVPEPLIPRMRSGSDIFGQDNRKIFKPEPVIQKVGERAAVRKTMHDRNGENEEGTSNGGVRRGNRKGSLVSNGYGSLAMVHYIRKQWGNLIKDFIIKFPECKENIKDYVTEIQAEAALESEAGNCEEFSKIVYSHLIENTSNQWVYLCKFKVGDHGFVITSPINLENFDNFANNMDQFTVVDAWYGYKILPLCIFLGQFAVQASDISIVEKTYSNRTRKLNKDQIGFIREWIKNYMKDNENEILSDIDVNDYSMSPDLYGNDLELVRSIVDYRSETQQLDDLEESNIYIVEEFLLSKDQEKIKIVVSKMKKMEQASIDLIMKQISKEAIGRITDIDMAEIFANYTNMDQKKLYIKSLYGFGFYPNSTRINIILFHPGNKKLFLECFQYIKKGSIIPSDYYMEEVKGEKTKVKVAKKEIKEKETKKESRKLMPEEVDIYN